MSDLKKRLAQLSPNSRQLLAHRVKQARQSKAQAPLISGVPIHVPGASIVETFEYWVRNTPGAVALSDRQHQLNYVELDTQANRLTRRLLACGVTKESRVALCLERSIEAVVAILATMKAGATYVPLDPSHPRSRLEFILRDTAASALITNSTDRMHLSYTGEVVALDISENKHEPRDDITVTSSTDAESLAYIMYTSGSTGQPKGVCIEQQGITRLVLETNYIKITSGDCIAMASNLAFDASTFEVWGALLNGARLEILTTENLLSSDSLKQEIASRNLTILFLTTALFNEIANVDPTAFAGLRWLLFGGEAASRSAVERVVEFGKPTHLINVYGPTENTTFTTSCEIDNQILDGEHSQIPIGRVIDNSYVRVLDAQMHPVPIGKIGELYAGGLGLARGYLNRTDLTEAAFVADPFEPGSSARLYRTGDLVIEHKDGNLTFEGRNDDQVKIRGFRIEPAEVRRCIEDLAGVRSVVVLSNANKYAEKSLIAFLQLEPGGVLDQAVLNSIATSKLPNYMVPSNWISVEKWPLTANRKIDRTALLDLANKMPGLKQLAKPRDDYEAPPPSDIERRLVKVVAELFGIPQVNVTDNFFDIGGHSLLAMRLVFRIEQQFGVELQVREIFDYPVMHSLAQRIDALAQTEPEPAGSSKANMPTVDGSFPLSPMQQRLWFLEKLSPGTATYHIHEATHLSGPLDCELLEQALNILVDRHDALRTCIKQRGEEVVQFVESAIEITLPVTHLSSGESLQQRFDSFFALPFAFDEAPLFRAELIELGRDEHVFSLIMHHILSDGWSMRVFRDELGKIYRALSNHETPDLPVLRTQYSHYSGDIAQLDRQSDESEQIAYWRTPLQDVPVLDFPTDYPRPRITDPSGAACRATVGATLLAQIRQFCHSRGVTLFMLLMSVYQLLLSRMTNQLDIAVGVPIAGRNTMEVESVIGFFVNSLVIRGDLSRNPTFEQLLERMQETIIDAYSNSTVPFDRLVEEVQPARDLSRNPLYDVMLNMVPKHLDNDFGDLRASVIERESILSKFAITLYVIEEGSQLKLRLVYQTKLFSSLRMNRVLKQFIVLLQQTVNDPSRTLDCYTLLTHEDKALLPDPTEPIPEISLPSLLGRFLNHVEKTPELTAISIGSELVSYGELGDAARDLAAYLVERGVSHRDVVAVSGETSVGLVSAILAVLMIGGVILPIDPGLPARRKTLMLEQGNAARLLLLDNGGDSGSWVPERERPLTIDRLETGRGAPIGVNLRGLPDCRFEKPDPDAPAYIFFTSGSTGTPKAVLGCHKGLDHFIDWQMSSFGIGPTDRVAQLTNLSFDVFLRDIFLPLASGATLCIPPAQALLAELSWLEEAEISVLHIVPTRAANWLTDVPKNTELRSLRWVFFAGEPLHRSLVEGWRDTFPNSGNLVNLYGATETTLVKSYFQVPLDCSEVVIPIGKPMPQTQLLLLREGNHLCGVGERGEIAIRTPYRSLGYCNSPEQTRASFIANPFSDDPDDIIYLTGDCGAYLPDGSISIFGRFDDQLKIHGIRVEPAEVATAVCRHHAVESCHVGSTITENGVTRLAAYIVLRADCQISEGELRLFLEQDLPPAFVPSYYLYLDSLPRLPNGKIDRRSLPSPTYAISETYLAPQTEVQRQIALIWSELLKVPRIGQNDNFFLLGGHSLLATQATVRINKTLNVELTLRALFEAPTVAGISRIVENLAVNSIPSHQAYTAQQARKTYPLSFTQQRLWFLEQLEPGGAAYNNQTAYMLEGALDVAALQKALNEVARRHDAMRTTILVEDGEPVQTVIPEIEIRLRIFDLSHVPPTGQSDDLERRLLAEHRQSFNLAHPPLVRASLFRLSQTKHALSLTVHHVITDGWTNQLFKRELSHYYAFYKNRKTAPLADPAAQFGHYVEWQRSRLVGEFLSQELDWWTQYLSAASATELPIDFNRPAIQSGEGGAYWRQLPEDLVRKLKSFSQQQGATLFATTLAAFNALLFRYTQDSDIIIGTPVAGRNRLSDESIMGFLANTVVLRNRVSPNSTYKELVVAALDTVLNVIEHQEIPFEKLVEALAPTRDLSRNPLFQIMFAYQNVPKFALHFEEIKIDPIVLNTESTKFDLSMTLMNEGEGINCHFNFSTELFRIETIQRIAACYETLLRSALDNPDLPVTKLDLVTDEDRELLLHVWNDTDRDPIHFTPVHRLIETCAAMSPESIAVTCGDKELSYGQLNEQANKLASHLIALGVESEFRVGLLLERQPTMLVALLAVMKAGGTYVPLDRSYPIARLNYMLKDSGARLLITSSKLDLDLEFDCDIDVVDLVDLQTTLAGYNKADALVDVAASDLAYVIYTSGTTGGPKGVMIEHGSLSEFIQWGLDAFSDEERRVVLGSTSLCFDVSVLELLVTLAGGGRVVLVDHILDITECLSAAEVTMISGVPSALSELVSLNVISDSVRVVCSGGEPLSPQLADALLANTNIDRLIDAYGPTEDTVYSTHAIRSRGDLATVGRPNSNTRTYIVDEDRNLVPPGVPGELLLSSPGLARGYVNQPSLTNDRFVELILNTTGTERCYRTGDLARYMDDGRIVILGRLDHQVKVRGYRVETKEIEMALIQLPVVQRALVTTRTDASGNNELVAYIESGEASVDKDRVKQHLRQWLPRYMIPERIEVLEHFPRLPNGKVDRLRLPSPKPPQMVAEFEPPTTTNEKALAEIWMELLNLPRAGRADNFFKLGGHSLLAVRLVDRIDRRLGVKLPLNIIFSAPTIKQLAEKIDRIIESKENSIPQPVSTDGIQTVPRIPRKRPLSRN